MCLIGIRGSIEKDGPVCFSAVTFGSGQIIAIYRRRCKGKGAVFTVLPKVRPLTNAPSVIHHELIFREKLFVSKDLQADLLDTNN